MNIYEIISLVKTHFAAEESSPGVRNYNGINLVIDPYAQLKTPCILIEADKTNFTLSANKFVMMQRHDVSLTLFVSAQNKSFAVYKNDVNLLLKKVVETIHGMIRQGFENLKFEMGNVVHNETMLGSEKVTGIVLPLTITTKWTD